jgi:hypothetical protein
MCDALFAIFPRLKFVDENLIDDQVVHVVSEVNEVCDTLLQSEGVVRTAEELVDVIASSVSGLRIIAEKHGVDIDDVIDYVNAKNSARGYLAGASRTAGAHSGSTGFAFPASLTQLEDKESVANSPEEGGYHGAR